MWDSADSGALSECYFSSSLKLLYLEKEEGRKEERIPNLVQVLQGALWYTKATTRALLGDESEAGRPLYAAAGGTTCLSIQSVRVGCK